MKPLIRAMRPKNRNDVANIYEEGITTGMPTFESEVPGFEQWDTSHPKSCRLIADTKGVTVGWAALSAVSSRCVYGGVAEVSVYISKKAWGKGVGKALLLQLINESKKNGYWTLQSGIFPENEGSIQYIKK